MLTRHASYDPARNFELETTDLEYLRAGDEPLLARIYQPRGSGPFTLLVDVHGGAWCRGDRLNNEPMDRALAASGLVIAAIDFRLGPGHPYPASIADLNFAIRWLKAHAADFNAVPDQMGGLGTSSGGHQLVLSAMCPRDPRYAALPLAEAPEIDAGLAYLVAGWPVLDPYARYLFAQQTGRTDLAEMSEGYFQTVENMKEGNPQSLLDRGAPVELPPLLIIQGTADSNIPLTIPERFVASYRAAGGEIALEIFPDQPHSFGNTPGPASERALHLMKEFIARRLAR